MIDDDCMNERYFVDLVAPPPWWGSVALGGIIVLWLLRVLNTAAVGDLWQDLCLKFSSNILSGGRGDNGKDDAGDVGGVANAGDDDDDELCVAALFKFDECRRCFVAAAAVAFVVEILENGQ